MTVRYADHWSNSQTHVLGDAVIPQRLRSIRKGRARPGSPDRLSRPPKRQCSSQQSEDAAIAEMLLDLSNSPVGSPRDSEFSTEEELPLPLSPGRSRGSPASRNSKRSSAHVSDEVGLIQEANFRADVVLDTADVVLVCRSLMRISMMFSALPLQRKAARERGKFQDAASVVRTCKRTVTSDFALLLRSTLRRAVAVL